MASEAKSKWDSVYQKIEDQPPIQFPPQGDDCALIGLMSCYKFAAKMIGSGKRVLDVGCRSGFGSWLLAKECGYCVGVDASIAQAKANFFGEQIAFDTEIPVEEKWDGIVSLEAPLTEALVRSLNPAGVVIVREGGNMCALFHHTFSFHIVGHTLIPGEGANPLIMACDPKC